MNLPAWAHAHPARQADDARRRRLLLGICTLTFLSASPVLAHHVARGAHALYPATNHIGAMCLVALHELLAPVHYGFHVALAAGLAYAVWDRARAWWRMQSTLMRLHAAPLSPDSAIATAAAAAGLAPAHVRSVPGLANPAFTAGLVHPTVYVSANLADSLDFDEMVAVLAHERAHVERRDPLRLSILRFAANVFFWLPALRRMADDLADEMEVAADDVAAAREPLALASAIVRVAALTPPDSARPLAAGGAVGFARDGMLERRVRRLIGEPAAPRTHVTRGSLVAALAALVLAWTSGAVMAHPMGDGHDTPPHAMSVFQCERHPASALEHLFCRGIHADADHSDCRH